MYNFLDRYQLPKLNQDHINDLNNPTTPKVIEAVINNLTTKTSPETDGFHAVISDLQRRTNTNILQTIPQNRNRWNTT